MRIQRSRLLIIDDEPLVVDVLTSMLRDEFLISSASDGCVGYSMAMSNRPDIVLLDMNMAGWDGLRTLQAFRKDGKLQRVPVLILSAESKKVTALAARMMGANGYILKREFQKAELLSRLNPWREHARILS
jgi:two-component system chemotaxis response regulator CheY